MISSSPTLTDPSWLIIHLFVMLHRLDNATKDRLFDSFTAGLLANDAEILWLARPRAVPRLLSRRQTHHHRLPDIQHRPSPRSLQIGYPPEYLHEHLLPLSPLGRSGTQF